jgi:hypothetical protein
MPLTGSQKTNYAQLLADAQTLRTSLSNIDPDQAAIKFILNLLVEVQAERTKDHKNK